jgi:hypothetical protein
VFFDEFDHFVPVASGDPVHATVDGFVFVFEDDSVARSIGMWRSVWEFASGEDIGVFVDKLIVKFVAFLR